MALSGFPSHQGGLDKDVITVPADIVNLRQARKAQARAAKVQQAEANRQKHGRTKAARRHDAAKKLLDETRLDGLLREPPKSTDAT